MKVAKYTKMNMAVALGGVLAITSLSACNKNVTGSNVEPAEAAPLAAVADVVDDGTQDRVAQLSLAEGNVSILPVDADDWQEASVNEPVLEGYQVYADDDSRGELLIGEGKYARFADGAAFTVSRLDPEYAQFELGSGTCELAFDQWTNGDYYELSAPGGALVPRQAGSYRVDVLPNGGTRVIVLRGSAEITTPNGTFLANEGDVIDLGDQPAQVNVVSGAAGGYNDAFYDWSGQRDVYYRDIYSHPVPEPVRVFEGRNDIYGVLALAAFGAWQALDDHNDRYCWVPNDARDAGWSPYQNGHWGYGSTIGWTWVSDDQWGWAPYHYGRWDHTDRWGWAWSPYYDQQIVGVSGWRQRYRWHPAEVYFCQPPNSRDFAWVPLAPGEPYVPYTAAFVSSPNARVVDFRPRYLRERRGIYVVTPDELERRQRPHRADREFVSRIERIGPDHIQAARLPKAQRIVAQENVARVRPAKADIDRAVVVTKRSLERPVKPATQRQLARNNRQIRRANDKTLTVRREAVTAANAPKPIDRGKGHRAGERAAADKPDARAPVPTAQSPARVEKPQNDRAQRRAERQQAAPTPIGKPQATQADRQQRRAERQKNAKQPKPAARVAAPKGDRVKPQKPARVERAPKVRATPTTRVQSQRRPRAGREASPKQAAPQRTRAPKASVSQRAPKNRVTVSKPEQNKQMRNRPH